MKSSEKFKLCPNCDGKAPFEVVICPFCAQNFNEPPKSKTTLTSSYTPPYSVDRTAPVQAETKNLKEEVKVAVKTQSDEKSLFLPVALLTIGCNLVILSALLIILSHDGKLELEWSSSYWMLYAALGFPLIFIGYKILKKES